MKPGKAISGFTVVLLLLGACGGEGSTQTAAPEATVGVRLFLASEALR